MNIKGEFIRRTLKDEGNRWLTNQKVAMESVLTFNTGNLINNRFMSVSQNAPLSGTLTFEHSIQQRFLDLKSMTYGDKTVRRKRNIHNRFAFHHYNMIARKLMFGFTNEVAESIKKDFQQYET